MNPAFSSLKKHVRRSLRLRRDSLLIRALSTLLIIGTTLNAPASPAGMTVGAGTATMQQSGAQTIITASSGAVISWQSFNIAAGETTTFQQPSASAIVWNRINDQNPSLIYGNLHANGVVVLLNSSGFYFGPNSFVSAAGLVVSTAQCRPPENNGGTWEFNGPPPLASIVNYGSIKVGAGGSTFLIADRIENHGTIEAPDGTIGLAAGQHVLLSERPDGRGMSLQVTLPQGSVDNSGNLVADAGTIALSAQVVNNRGLIQANTVRDRNGVIELIASDSLALGADSQIRARGDDSAAGSAGGKVVLKSGNNFSDNDGSLVTAAGGASGGNGGNIEVSAPNVLSLASTLDARAHAGWLGGTFYFDPVDIVLGSSTFGGAINVNTAFAGFSTIILQASGDITLKANTTWDLGTSTGVSTGQLTLQAGGDIIFNSGARITDANNWSATLQAGYDAVNNLVAYGAGSILLNGNSFIQTRAGNLNLEAGQDITVNSGFVRTTGGGNVSAWALAGNVDTGTYAHGYVFNLANSVGSVYCKVDPFNGVGGISTQAGGDVSITAGGNVTSYLPYGNSASTIGGDAGAGAFGPQAGNVTIVAGGNVTGHYVVANGTGAIHAGVAMDANGNPITDAGGNYVLAAGSTGSAGTADNKLALSLISGGWTVDAASDIYLQEVRNPNGVFNKFNSGGGIKPTYHYFDYAPGDYVNLSAGNSVQLGDNSSSLPRDNSDGVDVPFIYAPILNITAGAGGVTFNGDSDPYNKLILFPSPQGGLTITTTDGGSLTGNLPVNADGSPAIFDLIVSDSGQTRFYDNLDIFGLTDHAATPIHLNDPTPIVLNISGNMSYVLLGAPEAAQITVGGNLVNSRFQGMNLHSTDVTSIHVAGDIINRSEFTTVTAAQVPNLGYLNQVYPESPLAANLAKNLFYNPVTHSLTFQGTLTPEILSLLQGVQIQVAINGVPQVDALGNPVTQTVSILDPVTLAALQVQYAALGPVPTTRDSGYILGGGGRFDITAHSIDLGTTLGIQSQGVAFDTFTSLDGDGNSVTAYPLAQLLTQGADIHVNVTGNLDMFSTSIASWNGGAISIFAGGDVNVGSDVFTGNSAAARGIYTSAQSDVSVIANGNINVNGSRIAAYDGGNVTVESLHGNINAGNGGAGYVVLNSFYVDPVTHQVYLTSPTIPGSGILTTTFPERNASYPAPPVTVGNILVETPNGSVNANAGGIIQLPLNHADNPNATVEVLAGYELRDSGGNAVNAGGIAGATPVLTSAGRNIDATGSGVIAQNAVLKASGDITGVIFARGNIDIAAIASVNVTALAQGQADISGGSLGTSTIIGLGGISASGDSSSASLLSNNQISGATGGQTGFAQGTAANATSQAEQSDDAAKTVASTTADEADDQNKKKKGIGLAQKVGRVTVLLPAKSLSENQSSKKPL